MENDTTSGFMLCPNDGMRFPVAKSRFVSMHTLARSQQGKNKSQRKEQVRKGGLPALSDGLSCWDHSGGKPPFLTCSLIQSFFRLKHQGVGLGDGLGICSDGGILVGFGDSGDECR